MSKYATLANHLASLDVSDWIVSFEEIEAVLGFALPQSAHLYPAWWANQTTPGHSQNQGWLSVGWRTEELDLANKRVTFRAHQRTMAPPDRAQAKAAESPQALSMAQAKLALARFYEVSPENVEITIRG